MSIEIERKYLDVDFDSLRESLVQRGAEYKGRRFESNMLFDNPDRICEKEDRVIRLRINETPQLISNIFTIKWPQENETKEIAGVKIREELEIDIAQPDVFIRMLEQMGFKMVLCYEKIRESWQLPYHDSQTDEQVKIELDRLPFCNAVEIEASYKAIDHFSNVLGLDKFKISTTSYTKLYKECLGLNPEVTHWSLTFDPGERKRLRRAMGLS